MPKLGLGTSRWAAGPQLCRRRRRLTLSNGPGRAGSGTTIRLLSMGMGSQRNTLGTSDHFPARSISRVHKGRSPARRRTARGDLVRRHPAAPGRTRPLLFSSSCLTRERPGPPRVGPNRHRAGPRPGRTARRNHARGLQGVGRSTERRRALGDRCGHELVGPAARFVSEGEIDCVLCAGRYTLLEQNALDDLFPIALERTVSVVLGGVFNARACRSTWTEVDVQLRSCAARAYRRSPATGDSCHEFDVPLRAAALQFAWPTPQ